MFYIADTSSIGTSKRYFALKTVYAQVSSNDVS